MGAGFGPRSFFDDACGFGGIFSALAIPRLKRSSAPGSSLGGLSVMAETADQKDGNELKRAFELVGQFMWNWAGLEERVNNGYRRLFRLTGVEGYMATANLTLRDKIHAIRTVVHWYCQRQGEWAVQADKDLRAIIDMSSERRNVAAHNRFLPHASGGVEFITIKAKGKFSVPDVIWTPEDFEAIEDEIERLSKRVGSIVGHAVISRNVAAGASQLGNALAQSPTQTLNALAVGWDPPPQLPDSRGFLSPTQTEAPQTPPEKRASKPKPRNPKARS